MGRVLEAEHIGSGVTIRGHSVVIGPDGATILCDNLGPGSPVTDVRPRPFHGRKVR